MSAIYLAKNQVYHARTKHIDVKYLFCAGCSWRWRYWGEEDSHQRQSPRHTYKGDSQSQV